MNAPEINADRVAAKQREEERVRFLREYALKRAVTSDDEDTQEHQREEGGRPAWAERIVADGQALFDAIEATRVGK